MAKGNYLENKKQDQEYFSNPEKNRDETDNLKREEEEEKEIKTNGVPFEDSETMLKSNKEYSIKELRKISESVELKQVGKNETNEDEDAEKEEILDKVEPYLSNKNSFSNVSVTVNVNNWYKTYYSDSFRAVEINSMDESKFRFNFITIKNLFLF